MKKFLMILLSAICICGMLVGCGNKEEPSPEPESSSASETLTPQESDTMHLNMLFTLMSTPDRGVTELLGEGEKTKYRADGSLRSRQYNGIVCGKEITFIIVYDEYSDVSMIDIYFDDSVTEKQLADTVCELTGRKPVKNVWNAENAKISLQKTDSGLCITLEPFTAEGDSEDTVQY